MRDNTHEHDFSAIPSAACQFAGGEVALGDNGPGAKSAPVRIKARSGQPLEHWFWGKVVHDLAGMRLHKSRLTIDYAHNDSEVLGYLNHFESESGDLMTSGAIIPFSEGDRASEVLFKMREGVPYEASIFFGGDGIKVQEVAEGEVSPVNGYDFAGPGVIIREWPLRGVAICPYGADANTESVAMSSGTSFSAEQWPGKAGEDTATGEYEMNTEAQAVEAQEEQEAVEAVEALSVEAEAVVTEEETAKTEDSVTDAAPETSEADAEPVTELDRAEADALRARLSAVEADKAQLTARVESADADNARIVGELTQTTEALKAVTAERDELRTRLAAVENGAPPVSAAPAGEGEQLTPWQKAQRAQRR